MLSSTKSAVLCSLDSLLDFRLRALTLSQSEMFVRSILGDKYLYRISDDFGRITTGFDKLKYEEVINSGDKTLMKHTALTSLVFYLADQAEHVNEDVLYNDQYENMIFDINTYPYDFSESEEAKKLLIGSLRSYLPMKTEINVVRYSLEELTPKFIKDNYTSMFIYYHHRWVMKHYESLKQCPIPDVTVFTPSLEINHVEVTGNELKHEVLKDMNKFEMLELMVSEYYRLYFLEAADFSIISDYVHKRRG